MDPPKSVAASWIRSRSRSHPTERSRTPPSQPPKTSHSPPSENGCPASRALTCILRNALNLHPVLSAPLPPGCSSYSRKDAQRVLRDSIGTGPGALDGRGAFRVLGGLAGTVRAMDDPSFRRQCYGMLIMWCA
eukprot:CAMPEP_0194296614 /NCGR_PEP_ID=MMETSP0169-20130528/56669_1 /TAXON_ID=218684 /ORGANISM="Corethron pennatum, Strain L29A3" /LENGTH=132 /DNA_ID=CAMNT_0039046139 /DNA_START=367 /DNA_END=762 /DNA_ORIENTATION=-